MSAFERHYTSIEIAKQWNLSDDTIRAIFSGLPGVLKIIRPETRNKRGYVTLRIPESVVQKVHAELWQLAA